MKHPISIRCEPRFYLPMTLVEALVLKEIAMRHYDATCKSAAMPGPGGFINGWINQLTPINDGEEEHDNEKEPLTSATWRQLDLVLKILEMTHPISAEKATIAFNFGKHIRMAMTAANEELRKIEFLVHVDGQCTKRDPLEGEFKVRGQDRRHT